MKIAQGIESGLPYYTTRLAGLAQSGAAVSPIEIRDLLAGAGFTSQRIPMAYYADVNGFGSTPGGFGGLLTSTLGGLITTGAERLGGILRGHPAGESAPTQQPAPGSATRPPAPVTSTGTSIRGPATAVGIGAAAGGILQLLHGGGGHARYGSPGEKGYHMIKRGPNAGKWVRNRHRNVANIRALRRALSRAHGFERICRKVLRFTHPGGHRGRPVFRRRRRSR